MSLDDPSDNQLSELCRLQAMYLDGVLGSEDLIVLNELLRSNPSALYHFISLCEESSLARELFLAESYSGDAREVLAELLKSQPDTNSVNMSECLAVFDHIPVRDTAKEVAVNRFLPTPWPQVICFAAIVLIFAGALFLMTELYSANQGAVPMAGPSTQRDVVPPKIASITATENAVWETRSGTAAPSVGDVLSSGQRLTLSTGLALITTSRGAEVTIEGPCTIEFIDHANGFRLITGKLVAYCPTPTSRGLLVLTPHSQVVDLGTEFGIEAYPDSNTDIVVFEGSVAITELGADSHVDTPTVVSAGEGRRIDLYGRMTLLTTTDVTHKFEQLIHYADRRQTRLFHDALLTGSLMGEPAQRTACNDASDHTVLLSSDRTVNGPSLTQQSLTRLGLAQVSYTSSGGQSLIASPWGEAEYRSLGNCTN